MPVNGRNRTLTGFFVITTRGKAFSCLFLYILTLCFVPPPCNSGVADSQNSKRFRACNCVKITRIIFCAKKLDMGGLRVNMLVEWHTYFYMLLVTSRKEEFRNMKKTIAKIMAAAMVLSAVPAVALPSLTAEAADSRNYEDIKLYSDGSDVGLTFNVDHATVSKVSPSSYMTADAGDQKAVTSITDHKNRR